MASYILHSLRYLVVAFVFFPDYLFGITEEEARNFTYYVSSLHRKVKLVDGLYRTDTEYVSVDRVFLMDLDADTIKDAFVVLRVFAKDSLCELTVLLSSSGKPEQTNNILLPLVNVFSVRVLGQGNSFMEGSRYLRLGLIQEDFLESLCLELRNGKLYSAPFSCEETSPVVKKPAIYMYPPQEQEIRVKLQVKGFLTQASPPYEGEWKVKVAPDGKIQGGYSYLFYEALLSKSYPLGDEGWVVPYDSLPAWFDMYLPLLGLKGREIEDFKEYWLQGLDRVDFYEIRLIDREFLEENLGVDIQPNPDVFIRVFLHFMGTQQARLLKPPRFSTPPRAKYTAVEWGGIVASAKNTLSFLPSDTGQLVLRELILREHKLAIRISSQGCTDKSTIEVKVRRPAGLRELRNSPAHYEVIFFRKKPDYCRAFLPEGVVLEYDIKKDLGIETKAPYLISVQNPIYPLTANQQFFQFSIGDFQIEEPQLVDSARLMLRQGLLQATITAIQREIHRYESSSLPERKDRVKELREQLKFYQSLQPSTYQLGGEGDSLKSYGPLMPPLIKEIEVLLQEPLQVGTLLQLKNSSRSGPFYHVAGWSNDLNTHLEPGLYTAKLYLVYKREYFAHIPNYYVFIEWMKK